MENSKGEIVLFPKWREKLREKGLEAVRHQQYEEAIESLEPLFHYREADDEVITGLLISWVGTGEYVQAEEVCLNRMKVSESAYFQYLHIYITILFHEGKYRELMTLVEEVLEQEDLPGEVRTQLWQMYNVSKDIEDSHQKEEQEYLMEEWQEAINGQQIEKQYSILMKLKSFDPAPLMETFRGYLTDEETHPVIKTAIILWFQSHGVEESTSIHKFGKTISIVPVEIGSPSTHYIVKHLELRLTHIEQEHPIMYDIIVTMLHRYIYIRYPFLPTENEVTYIIEALKMLGNEYLQLEETPIRIGPETESYKKDIEVANQQYRAITGE